MPVSKEGSGREPLLHATQSYRLSWVSTTQHRSTGLALFHSAPACLCCVPKLERMKVWCKWGQATTPHIKK